MGGAHPGPAGPADWAGGERDREGVVCVRLHTAHQQFDKRSIRQLQAGRSREVVRLRAPAEANPTLPEVLAAGGASYHQLIDCPRASAGPVRDILSVQQSRRKQPSTARLTCSSHCLGMYRWPCAASALCLLPRVCLSPPLPNRLRPSRCCCCCCCVTVQNTEVRQERARGPS